MVTKYTRKWDKMNKKALLKCLVFFPSILFVIAAGCHVVSFVTGQSGWESLIMAAGDLLIAGALAWVFTVTLFR